MDKTTEQFIALRDERMVNNLSTEGYFWEINDIAKEHPELAKEAVKEYEFSFSNVKKNDTSEFLKYWWNKWVKRDAYNGNGLELEMLSRYLGDFITSHPEFAEKGFELIKKTSSAKCHDNTSIRYYSETFGDILSVCPKKLEKDVISAWEKFTNKKSLFREGDSFSYAGLCGGIKSAVENKPQLATRMAQMLTAALKKHPCKDSYYFGVLKTCWRSLIKADKKLAKIAAASLLQIRKTKSQEEANSYSYTLDEFYNYLPKSEKVEKTPAEVQNDIAIENEKRFKKLRDKIAPLGNYFVNGNFREIKTGCNTMQGYVPYYSIFTFTPKSGKLDWRELGDVKKTFSAYLKPEAKITSAEYGETNILRHDGDKHNAHHDAWKINVKADKRNFLIVYPGFDGDIEVLSDDKNLKFKPHEKGYQEEESWDENIILLKAEPVKEHTNESTVTKAVPIYEYDGNKIDLAGANLIKGKLTIHNSSMSSFETLEKKRISVADFKKLETKMKNNELKKYKDYRAEQRMKR